MTHSSSGNKKMIKSCEGLKCQRGNCPCRKSKLKNCERKRGNPSCLPAREIGEDGHYYECDICGDGGDLLCCEMCPSTFHLHCLSPPLECVPTEKWICPNCSQRPQNLSSLSFQSLLRLAEAGKLPGKRTERCIHNEQQQNAVNQIGDETRIETSTKTKELKVYTRRKNLRKREDVEPKNLAGVCDASEMVNDDPKHKLVKATSLLDCSSIQSESAKRDNDLNAIHRPIELNEKPMAEQGEEVVRQAIKKRVHTGSLNINQRDRLWVQRDALSESMKGHYIMQNVQRKRSRHHVPRAKYTEAGLARREKFAKLRARQKARIALRNRTGPVLSSGLVGPHALVPLNREKISEFAKVCTSEKYSDEPISVKPLRMVKPGTTNEKLLYRSSDQNYTNRFQTPLVKTHHEKSHYQQDKSVGRFPVSSPSQALDEGHSAAINVNQKIENRDISLCLQNPAVVPQVQHTYPRRSSNRDISCNEQFGSMNYNSRNDRGTVDIWSQDELDALWIGVRRHGQTKWEAICRDPNLNFAEHRTSEDLWSKWKEEKARFLNPGIIITRGSTNRGFGTSRNATERGKSVDIALRGPPRNQLTSSQKYGAPRNIGVGGVLKITPKLRIEPGEGDGASSPIQADSCTVRMGGCEVEWSSEGTISD